MIILSPDRTLKPHGLLMYQTIHHPPLDFPVYELYVLLENGRLKVIYEIGAEQESIVIGQGLNQDQWHRVNISIDASSGTLLASLERDNNSASIRLQPLSAYVDRTYIPPTNILLFFGGTDSRRPIQSQQYNFPRFIGCMGKIRFRSHNRLEKQSSDIVFAAIRQQSGLQYPCINKCRELNLCAHHAVCVNHYTHSSCDCFGTVHEDWQCRSSNLTTITLRGYSYLSYKIYSYKDRVHSDVNRIGVHFKTSHENGILLFAKGEQPKKNYVAMSLSGGNFYFEMALGDGFVNVTIDDLFLTDNQWHNVTVKHHKKAVHVYLDNRKEVLTLNGSLKHLHVDPEVYIGGVPLAFYEQARRLRIPFDISQKFVGCLRSVYFNARNILFDLNSKSKVYRYQSVFPPEFGCSRVETVPVTFPTKSSYFSLPHKAAGAALNLSLEFKTEQDDATIAQGRVFLRNNSRTLPDASLYWFLRLKSGVAIVLISNTSNPLLSMWSLKNTLRYLNGRWQQIGFQFSSGGTVSIISNYHHEVTESVKHLGQVEFHDDIVIGASSKLSAHLDDKLNGIRGCVREIEFNGEKIDPRGIINSKTGVFGRVTLDDCQLVNPCHSPKACENNGKCVPLETGDIYCHCNKTGYIGKTCHFCK